MRDDFLTRDWADHHGQLGDTLHRLIETISVGLKRAHRYQFEAPWRPGAFR